MLPAALSSYLRLMTRIEKYIQNHPKSPISRLSTITIYMLSSLLCKIRGIKFPQRTIGSLWFVHRYRFEFCMNWLEPESILWVRRLVKPDMNVIDVGAHIGYYTKNFSHLTGPAGRVFAIEPSPENFGVLVDNLKSWGRNNVTAYNNAASDRSGMVNLHISPGHSNHSLVAGYTPAEKTIPIQALRLDDLLPEQKIDFIKIDVEGYEPHVINGMRNLIRASEDIVMLVEYNRVALAKDNPSPQSLLDLLTKLGFQYQAILEDGYLGEIPEEIQTVNLLCTQKPIS